MSPLPQPGAAGDEGSTPPQQSSAHSQQSPTPAPAKDSQRPQAPAEGSRGERRRLQWDTLVGFLFFFSVVAVVQAVLNVLAPEPRLFPAVLALVLVVATVSAWRYGRRRR